MTCVQNTVILQLRSGLHLNLSKKKSTLQYFIIFTRCCSAHVCATSLITNLNSAQQV